MYVNIIWWPNIYGHLSLPFLIFLRFRPWKNLTRKHWTNSFSSPNPFENNIIITVTLTISSIVEATISLLSFRKFSDISVVLGLAVDDGCKLSERINTRHPGKAPGQKAYAEGQDVITQRWWETPGYGQGRCAVGPPQEDFLRTVSGKSNFYIKWN